MAGDPSHLLIIWILDGAIERDVFLDNYFSHLIIIEFNSYKANAGFIFLQVVNPSILRGVCGGRWAVNSRQWPVSSGQLAGFSEKFNWNSQLPTTYCPLPTVNRQLNPCHPKKFYLVV